MRAVGRSGVRRLSILLVPSETSFIFGFQLNDDLFSKFFDWERISLFSTAVLFILRSSLRSCSSIWCYVFTLLLFTLALLFVFKTVPVPIAIFDQLSFQILRFFVKPSFRWLFVLFLKLFLFADRILLVSPFCTLREIDGNWPFGSCCSSRIRPLPGQRCLPVVSVSVALPCFYKQANVCPIPTCTPAFVLYVLEQSSLCRVQACLGAVGVWRTLLQEIDKFFRRGPSIFWFDLDHQWHRLVSSQFIV